MPGVRAESEEVFRKEKGGRLLNELTKGTPFRDVVGEISETPGGRGASAAPHSGPQGLRVLGAQLWTLLGCRGVGFPGT